jgi:hypothetical protein
MAGKSNGSWPYFYHSKGYGCAIIMKVLGSLKLLRCVNIKDELFIKLPIFE